ncbi:hypothetical protein Cgig2_006943 [Carnegiea gigantea]|uniref:Uncharacterized protein n=1 Tax=Carnegiea gigantea TaxID=171969 RepID=A0A9Q1KDV4_9CARY|nr:hypothetical protein Cgig2_006943 [Carnegiea gigantea]
MELVSWYGPDLCNVLLANTDRNFDLPQASRENVNAEYLKGLINVVPGRRLGIKQGDVLQSAGGTTKNISHIVSHFHFFGAGGFKVRYTDHCCAPHLLQGCIIHATFISDEIWGSTKKQTLLMPILGQLSTPVVLNMGIALVSLTVVRCCSVHDCGIYVMVLMDLLSLGVKQPILPQRYVR